MNTVHTSELIAPSYPSLIRASVGLTLISLGLCGFLYSAAATGLGQLLFPQQANGSLIEMDGKVLGSSLVGQPFHAAQYFQGRPSAANYDPMLMAGSNLARTNPALNKMIEQRIVAIEDQDQVKRSQIPSDLVTASAMLQVKRITKQRTLSEQQVIELIQRHTAKPTFGLLGQPRIHVLKLNLALDQISK